jgi:hypothetical protein
MELIFIDQEECNGQKIIACAGDIRNTYKILLGKSESSFFGMSTFKWEYNIDIIMPEWC